MRTLDYLLLLILLAIPGGAQELISSTELHTSAVGFAGQKSPTFQSFENVLKQGESAETVFIKCLKDGTPAARLYGAIGLFSLDKEKGQKALQSLSGDHDTVTLFQGCIKSNHEVGELATALLKEDGRTVHLGSFMDR
jgi:hypothetical protein